MEGSKATRNTAITIQADPGKLGIAPESMGMKKTRFANEPKSRPSYVWLSRWPAPPFAQCGREKVPVETSLQRVEHPLNSVNMDTAGTLL